jgi:serine/threonine protein kinase
MAALAAGTTLCDGRYRLDAVLGRGGMAIVWRATDLQLERDVAIKVISDVLADDPRFVARFEREARLAAMLNHPNLVKVFDFSVDAERPLLVMEYIAGGTLSEARGQALDVDALARALLDAVAHIHAAGIVHRDIKPANVLLNRDGSPRLTDFGIARGEEMTGLTQTGQVLGTLRYIAPEVAAGEPATVRSDLYGLGVLLGEVTGERSDALGRLLARLTARDPAERPGSAGEAIAELDPTRILSIKARATSAPIAPDPTTAALAPGPLNAALAPDPATVALAVDPPAREPAGAPETAHPAAAPFVPRRSHAIAAAIALIALLAVIVAAGSGGNDSNVPIDLPGKQVQAAPAGAPADQQIDRLQQIIRAAPKKR